MFDKEFFGKLNGGDKNVCFNEKGTSPIFS